MGVTALKTADQLVSTVTICAVQYSRFDAKDGRRHSTDDPVPLYLGVSDDVCHNCTATTMPDTEWEIVLADIPVINICGINKLEICTTPTERVNNLSDASRHFVMKILRAMLEIGSFHITGHGGNTDLFSLVHGSVGLLPWRELSEDDDDGNQFKERYSLMKFKEGKFEFCRYTREYLGAHLQIAKDYFDFAETLCDFLLHAMALGTAMTLGVSEWRHSWRDDRREMSLHTSTYYPGMFIFWLYVAV